MTKKHIPLLYVSPLGKFEKEALDLSKRARQLTVLVDNESLQKANEFVHIVKKMIKEIKDFFKPLKEKAKASHQALVDQEKELLKPYEQSEDIVKPQIGSYLAELERIRREAEEKARREEEDRKRLEEEKLQKALEAENAGRKEEAERIISEKSPEVKPFIPPPPAPKLKGTSIRKIAKWRCINLKEVPRDMLMLDSAKITRIVRETKGQKQIPGIEIYFEDSAAFRL